MSEFIEVKAAIDRLKKSADRATIAAAVASIEGALATLEAQIAALPSLVDAPIDPKQRAAALLALGLDPGRYRQ